MYWRKRYLIVVLVITSMMIISACQPEAAPSDEEPEEETPVEEVDDEPVEEPEETIEVDGMLGAELFLDPALIGDSADCDMICGHIFDTLVTLNEDGSIGAGLADYWSVSDDGLDYIFELRAFAEFHDGTPANADAVIANLDRWFNPGSPLRGDGAYDAWAAAFGGFLGEVADDGTNKSTVDGFEKVDEYTVMVHLSKEDPEFLAKLADIHFAISSPSTIEIIGDSYGTQIGYPIGTGAYFVDAWTDDLITLEPYFGYWGEIPSEILAYGFE